MRRKTSSRIIRLPEPKNPRSTWIAYHQKTHRLIAEGTIPKRVYDAAEKTGKPFVLASIIRGTFIGNALPPLPDPRKLDEELAEVLYARRDEFRELDEIQARSWELAETIVLGAT